MHAPTPLAPAADPRVIGGAMSDAGLLCALGARRPLPPRR